MPPPPDPIPALKQQVADAIVERIRVWTQCNAAELLRTDQPRIADLRNGKLERFSLERLLRFVARRGGSVAITITWLSPF